MSSRLNPLKSGPAFGPPSAATRRWMVRLSQSPQIGACFRTRPGNQETHRDIPGLNPLKSGPAFGPPKQRAHRPPRCPSQSPQIGACFRTQKERRMKEVRMSVSIPSNRGLLSDIMVVNCIINRFPGLNPLKSGPAFGHYKAGLRLARALGLNPLKSGPAFGPTPTHILNRASLDSLNPLKSGPAFGLPGREWTARELRQVSIPSNRGLLSDTG